MDHVAIDLGAKKSQICVRSADGQILEEKRWPTRDLKGYLAGRPTSRVVVETCAEAFCVADAARNLGHETRVVPATLVKTLGVGARRLKTDQRDARALSEVSCRIDLPSVHIPKTESRDRKSMCGMREALIGARTKVINTVRGWLRSRGRRIERGGRASFRQRVEAAWDGQLPSYVDRQLQVVDVLNVQIATADAEVKAWVEADETCGRLMTVPGVGPLTALRFVAAIDDVTRFENAHQVESYLGLVPGEYSSSERQQRLSITKAGPRALRWVLVQAAWALHMRCRKPEAIPLQLWSHRIEQRRGKRTAIIALARKLAGILYALWREGSVYDGARGAKMI
jgi:transposase